GGRDRTIDAGADEKFANVRIRLKQHVGREEHVVNADYAFVVQLDVVDEWGTAMQREIQRVVEIVIEVRARADQKVDQPAFHQFDNAAAQPGGSERTCNRQGDRRVVVRQQHLVGEDVARFTESRGIERLESFVDEIPD